MKTIIVGASHGGHESAIGLLSKYNDVEVTVYEAGDFVSFMSCGMQSFLEGKVTARDDVRNFKPSDVTDLGGKIFANSQVTDIDVAKHEITIKNSQTGETKTDTYDKLILSSGVKPAAIPVPGADLPEVWFMRGRDWAIKIDEAQKNDTVKNVVVVGAGYIGVEAAEVFNKAGKQVTLIDTTPSPLNNYLDTDLGQHIVETFNEKGVNLAMNQRLTAIKPAEHGVTVVTDTSEHAADVVIIAAGVHPNTEWLKELVALDERGFIKTDEYLRTSAPDVYAIGDAIWPLLTAADQKAPIALASATRKEARYVVSTIKDEQPSERFIGVNGTSALPFYDWKIATTGLNEMSANKMQIKGMASSSYEDNIRPDFILESAGNVKVYSKLYFDEQTHKIMGGQILSTHDVTANINTIALAIRAGLRLEDLADADFFFQPGFDRQWAFLNLAAQHALGDYLVK
ncbi:MAG: FAD-dependent oxidoreductase [Lactobacillaceae bacterium]|jgi:NADH peroxidase|nr:FAD-dependent oxidoreductase [Lactobacillaceae bacterium]